MPAFSTNTKSIHILGKILMLEGLQVWPIPIYAKNARSAAKGYIFCFCLPYYCTYRKKSCHCCVGLISQGDRLPQKPELWKLKAVALAPERRTSTVIFVMNNLLANNQSVLAIGIKFSSLSLRWPREAKLKLKKKAIAISGHYTGVRPYRYMQCRNSLLLWLAFLWRKWNAFGRITESTSAFHVDMEIGN